jgi:hypothetical protein
MVQEKRTSNDVVPARQRFGESVELEERRRGIALSSIATRVFDGGRTDVAPGDFERESLPRPPPPKSDGHVSTTGGHVQQPNWTPVTGSTPSLAQPADRRPEDTPAAADPIDARNGVEGPVVLPAVESRLVHDFGLEMSVSQGPRFGHKD